MKQPEVKSNQYIDTLLEREEAIEVDQEDVPMAVKQGAKLYFAHVRRADGTHYDRYVTLI